MRLITSKETGPSAIFWRNRPAYSNGILLAGYQEGELVPRTLDGYTTKLAEALKNNGLNFEVKNMTQQTYEVLKKKREAAVVHKAEFEREGHIQWFDMLMMSIRSA